MTNFFRRRRGAGQAGEAPVESALRRSLAAHAFEAPDADEVTRRILAATDDAPEPLRRQGASERPERNQWKTWGLPLVAAACVAAIVGVGATVASLDHGSTHHQQAASQGPSATSSVAPSTASSTPTTSQSKTAIERTSGLKDVKILDLTFFKGGGIALASAQCISQPGKTCTALLQTTDGTTWGKSHAKTPFNVTGDSVGCSATTCVDHIRFATSSIGYVYGPDALFMTTDGGKTWVPQKGGAEALETLSSNVIRVSASNGGSCLPDCTYTVQTSGLGSSTWSTVTMPGGDPIGQAGVQLARGGTNAYLLVTQHVDGGGGSAESTLYRSSDNGSEWTKNSGDPCPQTGGEVDSYQVAAGGANGRKVTVLCRVRLSGPYTFAVSTDAGAAFHYVGGSIPYADVADVNYTDGGGALPTVLAGDPATVLAVAGDGVWISRDGGKNFAQASGPVGTFSSVGFESNEVGRAVSADGTAIWTTRNAGRTWTRSNP